MWFWPLTSTHMHAQAHTDTDTYAHTHTDTHTKSQKLATPIYCYNLIHSISVFNSSLVRTDSIITLWGPLLHADLYKTKSSHIFLAPNTIYCSFHEHKFNHFCSQSSTWLSNSQTLVHVTQFTLLVEHTQVSPVCSLCVSFFIWLYPLHITNSSTSSPLIWCHFLKIATP